MVRNLYDQRISDSAKNYVKIVRKITFFQEWKKNYNVLIDGRNFYDQRISDSTKNYNKIGKNFNKPRR